MFSAKFGSVPTPEHLVCVELYCGIEEERDAGPITGLPQVAATVTAGRRLHGKQQASKGPKRLIQDRRWSFPSTKQDN